MTTRKLSYLSLIAAAAALTAACSGSAEPNDAVGAKVLRNLFEKSHVLAKIASFKKTQGRAAHVGGGDVYEYWYESEIQFPEGFEAKCAQEKDRGTCALLGIASDQTIKPNEVVKSEGSLHFSKSAKGGWTGEDGVSY
jgi:hypothetical protein